MAKTIDSTHHDAVAQFDLFISQLRTKITDNANKWKLASDPLLDDQGATIGQSLTIEVTKAAKEEAK